MKIPLLILLAALVAVTAASIFLHDPLLVGATGMGCALIGAFAASDYLVRQRKLTVRANQAILLAAFLISSAGIGNLPLRIIFHLYERHFQALAENLHERKDPAFPCRIGPFVILEGAPSSETGTILFMSGGDCLLFDPSERDCGSIRATRLSPHWIWVSRSTGQ